jgi:hypothetical protein
MGSFADVRQTGRGNRLAVSFVRFIGQVEPDAPGQAGKFRLQHRFRAA